ncbi:MAG: hypothetical protein HFI06_07905 [Eubacterium sp.]|jgi:hypothetical protein|nr:hypothetical protein [Eubacterium sp.]NBI84857.1 hypothetical protein [Lachnospiraceae bacterium]
MQQTIKGRAISWLAFFLMSILLTAALPPSLAQAAVRVQWYNGGGETEIVVEAGAKFYIGDYVSIYSDAAASTASLGKASYRSQDKKVASVNGKGYLNAKKPGTTDVVVTCQGKTLTCHLTVEKKNTFEQTRSIKELKAAAKALAKGMPKKINAAKGYNLNRKVASYMEVYNGTAKELSYDGFLYEGNRPSRDKVDYKRSSRLAVPQAGRFRTADALLGQFKADNNPVSVNSKKTMRIASASASSKTGKIVVKLTKKLSAEQILGAQLAFPKENIAQAKTKANISMTIYDETANRYYKGKPVLKKGGRQFEVQPVTSTNGLPEIVKIEKGHVYMLGSELEWSNGVKMTAK